MSLPADLFPPSSGPDSVRRLVLDLMPSYTYLTHPLTHEPYSPTVRVGGPPPTLHAAAAAAAPLALPAAPSSAAAPPSPGAAGAAAAEPPAAATAAAGKVVDWGQNPLLAAWARPELHSTGADVRSVTVVEGDVRVEARWACTWLVSDMPKDL